MTTKRFNDRSTKVKGIPLSFMLSGDEFRLPPLLKRVKGGNRDYIYKDKRIAILENYTVNGIKHTYNRFVSVIWGRIVLNHFPLELVTMRLCRKCVYFRETIQVIGKYAFIKNKRITTVVIPPSVEEIGDFSFDGCANLRKIIFSGNSKLKKIGQCAFRKTAIKEIEFHSSLEDTGLSIFYKSKNIKKVTFSKNSQLKKINRNAFSGSSIESIEIPASLEVISCYAFYNCKSLKTICFPSDSHLEKIETLAFGFSSIESINFPDSLREIETLAFAECINLSSISNMNQFINSDERAFEGCTNLVEAEETIEETTEEKMFSWNSIKKWILFF